MQVKSYRLEPNVLSCALKHETEEQLSGCDTCKDQADKIQKTLGIWFFMEEIREALVGSPLIGRITTLDLSYDNDNHFMSDENFTKICSPEMPLVFGYNEKAKSPFLTIRFLDSIHNERAKISPGAKSFATILLGVIPNVGMEPYMHINKFQMTKNNEVTMSFKTIFDMDCGEKVGKYAVKLLKGQKPGKTVV